MRVLMTTTGSLGDLHPYLAIGQELVSRGHHVTVATCQDYEATVLGAGLDFARLSPDMPNWDEHPELMAKIMDAGTGTRYIIREYLTPALPAMLEQTRAAAAQADVLVSHPLTIMTPIVATLLNKPWVSTALAPLSCFSTYDPPSVSAAPWIDWLRPLRPWPQRLLYGLAVRRIHPWFEEYRELCRSLNVPAQSRPMMPESASPFLDLALFSRELGEPQRDWPVSCVQTGFPFFDGRAEVPLEPGLEEFLNAGPPPVVFTLGSSAVRDARDFYRVSSAAAGRLGVRAVLLIGRDPRNRLEALPRGQYAAEYARYSLLFPRAVATVHQGGVGTTGQAMRAGRPMIIMPYAHDQPDHAARIVRRGLGRTISRGRYTVDRVVRELRALLDTPRYAATAQEVGERIQRERGRENAADAIEQLVSRTLTAQMAARVGWVVQTHSRMPSS